MRELKGILLADAILDYLEGELEKSKSLEEFKKKFKEVLACVKEKKCEKVKVYLLILD